MNDRGQVAGPTTVWPGLVVAVVGIFVYDVVLDHQQQVTQPGDILCNGMWGCGPAPAWWWALFAVAILAVLAVFLAITIVERRESDADS